MSFDILSECYRKIPTIKLQPYMNVRHRTPTIHIKQLVDLFVMQKP